MNVVKNLNEMPYLFTSADDFGLSDPEKNRSEYERLSSLQYQTIHEDERVLIGVVTRSYGGEIFMLRKDVERLTYYVKFKSQQINGLGNTATQVVVWRRGAPGFKGITAYVFFGFLLENFDSIVSDAHQTQDGKKFWIDRMDDAVGAGLTVGLLDDQEIRVYDGSVPLDDWPTSLDAWGDTDEHEKRRFFISKKEVA